MNNSTVTSSHGTKIKPIRKYVQIHNWTNVKLDEFTEQITYKLSNWRPTVINAKLFSDDIANLITNIVDQYDKIKNEVFKQNDVFENVKINAKMSQFMKSIKMKLNEYKLRIIHKNIRNPNFSKKNLAKLRKINQKYPNLLMLEADKNRGNVKVNENEWKQFNLLHLNENNENFKKINENKLIIVKNAINQITRIINKYKHIITDYNEGIILIKSDLFNKIGKFPQFPKCIKKMKMEILLKNYDQLLFLKIPLLRHQVKY